MARETQHLKATIRDLGIDLAGVASLKALAGMPFGIPLDSADFFANYPYAIVLGAQMGKLGPEASGSEMSFLLERAAGELVSRLWEKEGYHALTVHTEDEFDPINRIGLMSLKVLAKEAGLGWQGRSLLIVSPEHGPIHRLIAVLTNKELVVDAPLENRCDGCSTCVDACPNGALARMPFEDRPRSRDDVLDLGLCLGDQGCTVCLTNCPYQRA